MYPIRPLIRLVISAWSWTVFDRDRKSTRLNSSHLVTSYAAFCLKKKRYSADKRLGHLVSLSSLTAPVNTGPGGSLRAPPDSIVALVLSYLGSAHFAELDAMRLHR